MSQPFDAIIIGAGQSGPFLANKFSAAGWNTALVERAHFGGTCLNNGCTPTKTLVASARAAHVARHAADYGITTGPVSVDMKAVKARKDKVVDKAVTGMADWLAGMDNLTLFRGSGSFVSPTGIAVNGQMLTAPKIFLNTGARPKAPDWPGLADVPYLDNISMMDLDVLPDHLIIAGASYVGLEFAQIYARFGARVTVITRGTCVASREDADISAAIQTILEAEGVRFLFETSDVSVAKSGSAITVSLTVAGTPTTLTGSHLLMAVGRTPNVEDLNLPAAGLSLNARGYIEVDAHLRTSVSGIYALGDVNGRGAFTHTSYNEFEIVADNLLNHGQRDLAGRIPVYALYIDPPLGRVGMSEQQVRASGRPALMATLPMVKVARARERGETQGFLKVLVDATTERVLGAAFLGIEGDETVQALLPLMAGDLPYTVTQNTMHIHPTVSELIPTLLGNLKPLG